MTAPLLNPPLRPQDHVQGRADAPVTLVEYGDYECPYCGMAHPIVRAVQRRMGDALRFAFRHFPLAQIHPHAEHAAEIAEAAGERGRFWPMHDLLFENQQELDDIHLVGYAAQLGIDAASAEAALRSHAFAEPVRRDFLSGVRSGVNGTPSFFINGVRYDGAWDEASLLAALKLAARATVPAR